MNIYLKKLLLLLLPFMVISCKQQSSEEQIQPIVNTKNNFDSALGDYQLISLVDTKGNLVTGSSGTLHLEKESNGSATIKISIEIKTANSGGGMGSSFNYAAQSDGKKIRFGADIYVEANEFHASVSVYNYLTNSNEVYTATFLKK